MRANVTDDCISCERCVEISPEVFQMGDEVAEVKVDPVPQESEHKVREAADECPTSAIDVQE